MEARTKKHPSEGSVVVQEVSQGESGSSQGFGSQRKANEGGETSVKEWNRQDERWVEKQDGYQQPDEKNCMKGTV